MYTNDEALQFYVVFTFKTEIFYTQFTSKSFVELLSFREFFVKRVSLLPQLFSPSDGASKLHCVRVMRERAKTLNQIIHSARAREREREGKRARGYIKTRNVSAL